MLALRGLLLVLVLEPYTRDGGFASSSLFMDFSKHGYLSVVETRKQTLKENC